MMFVEISFECYVFHLKGRKKFQEGMTGLPDNFDKALNHAVLQFEGKEGVSWKKKNTEGCYTEKSERRGMQINRSSI